LGFKRPQELGHLSVLKLEHFDRIRAAYDSRHPFKNSIFKSKDVEERVLLGLEITQEMDCMFKAVRLSSFTGALIKALLVSLPMLKIPLIRIPD
jgi:hypothetical protein